MNQSESINELAMALAKAQGQIVPALKDSNNPFFKSSYADLSSVWAACREPLSSNGLAVLQTLEHIDGVLNLVTTLAHASGQWIRSNLPVITQKADIQSLGSAITYCRRYSLSALVGVVADADDDGENAMARNQPQHQPKPKTQASKPVEKPIELISEGQGKELAKLMAQCSQDFQDKIWKHLTEDCQVSCYEQMKSDKWTSLMKRTKEEIEKK